MAPDPQTLRNTNDLADLTGKLSSLATTVAELATTVKYGEERNKDSRQDFKDMIVELRGIKDGLAVIPQLQVELTELNGEVGKWRHEIDNLRAAQQGFPLLKEAFAELKSGHAVGQTRLDELAKWRDRHNLTEIETTVKALAEWKLTRDGAAGVVRTGADWARTILGPVVSSLVTATVVGALGYYFVLSTVPGTRSTYMQKEVIGE